MKIQTQIIDRMNGVNYWEQKFKTQTKEILTIDEYEELIDLIQEYLEKINKL